MKALKEKRIGLRSLLRRGLVILSLFALVFASCNATDDDDGTPTTPPVYSGAKPARIEIRSWPTNDSYEGREVDLTGLELRVFYESDPTKNTDISWKTDTFSTYPHTAVGVIASDSAGAGGSLSWQPQTQYTLLWYSKEADKVFTAVLDLAHEGKTVIPIARATEWADIFASDPTNSGYIYPDADAVYNWSKGLRITGKLDKKMYVDDYPQLNEYVLQAEYANGKVKDIPLVAETPWKVVPIYDDVKNPTSATGELLITIGKNPLDADHPYVLDALKGAGTLAAPDYYAPDATDLKYNTYGTKAVTTDPGLTIRHTYEELYIVRSINVTTDAELDYFFYWMDDDADSWLTRLEKSKARVTVNYSGGAAPKEKSVKEWAELNAIWLNPIFDPDGGTVIDPDAVPFAVKGVMESSPSRTLAHGRNRDPKITISYRGAYYYIDTPVYTRLTNFEVTPVDGGESIAVDMRPRDNDVGAKDAIWFGKQVTAVATFQAYSDTEKTAPWPVTMSAEDGADIVTATALLPAGATADGAKGAPLEADKYSNNFGDISTNTRNNNRETAVTFVYTSPDELASPNIQVGPRTMRARVTVAWTNIQAP